MYNKKSIIIGSLSILLFAIGAIAIFVWVLNTLSQNKALTTKIITYQIDRLLDLDSEVINPHAYLDWDLQYKIRADKLTFINNKKDLVAVDDIQLNVFVPYLALRKIYITNMSGKNLYMDFERYENKKINIIEIFNITGFFKIYFHNSTISIDKYFFRFRDNAHKPSENMVITGHNILFSKFTLKKYFQFIMDGNINYNGTTTPFAINYNAKIPTIKKDYNLEVNLPDIDFKNFTNYSKEFAPNLTIKGQGNIRVKTNQSKFFHIDTTLRNIDIHSKKSQYSLKFKNATTLKTKFSYENKVFLIDEATISGNDFSAYTSGRVEILKNKKPKINLHVKINENSNGNSILQIIPRGIPALNHAIDKAKNHNLGGIVSGEIRANGILNHIYIDGQVHLDKANLGYGYDFPTSHVYLDFKKDKMFIESKYYQTHSTKEYVTVTGNVKITKPFILDLEINSQPNLDLVSTQKAVNIFSDVFNFKTGPVPVMGIDAGRGEIKLKIKGTPPNVYTYGKMTFRNGIASYPGLRGKLNQVYGEIYFNGDTINYKNIKGIQDGIWANAYGTTKVHQDGLTHFYLIIPKVQLSQAKEFIDNSSLIKNVSVALRTIENPKGIGQLNLVMISDKNSKIPYCEGQVNVYEGSCNITGLAYPVNNVFGQVDFNTARSILHLTGEMQGIKTKVTGTASPQYSELYIETQNADVKTAINFIKESPVLAQVKDAFNDFSDISGTINTRTKLYGNFSSLNPNFYTEINFLDAQFKYLDIPENIHITQGTIIAKRNNVMLNNISGTTMDSDFKLNGIITDTGLPTEQRDLKYTMSAFNIQNVNKILNSKIVTKEAKELLSKFAYKSGFIDVKTYIHNNKSSANIIFHNINLIYKDTKDNILIQSGEFDYSDNLLRLKNIVTHMTDSDFILAGTIQNYLTKPIFNLELAANLSETDFNKTLVSLFNLPLKLTGKIYTNILFVGNPEDWQLKMRTMIDEATYITYKNANFGGDLTKFVFLDFKQKNNNLEINTLDVYAPTYTKSSDKPDILAQVRGKIKNINSKTPYIDNVNVKFNDYMNISFINLLFSGENSQPFLSNGQIKGHVRLNGDIDNLQIRGKADVKDAEISRIGTTITNMNIDFEDDIIQVREALINMVGSESTINATLKNKFTLPITISNLELISEHINTDKMVQKFTQLFAYKTTENDKAETYTTTETAPIVIENGKVEIKEMIYNNLPVKDFRADFHITPQWDCSIKNLTANITNGEINGDVDYNFYTTDLKGNLEIKDVIANTFATTFLNLPNEMYGNLNGNAKFSTRGKNHDDMIKNLNGMIYFKLNNGRMIRLGSIEYMLKIANTVKGGISRLNLNALVNIVAPRTGYFDTIEGDLNVQDGVILTDKITFKSNELNLFMTGMYNMNNSFVNSTIIGQIPLESKESILWLGPLGKISLNSLVKQLTRNVEKEHENQFLYNPLAYINDIPGLKNNKGNYRFFVVTLKGNLYAEDYVDTFKWIK